MHFLLKVCRRCFPLFKRKKKSFSKFPLKDPVRNLSKVMLYSFLIRSKQIYETEVTLGNGFKGKGEINETKITFILLPVILEVLGKANRKVWKKNP